MSGPGPGGMMGGVTVSPIMILLAPSVQKEVKLNEEQKTKVYSYAKTATQKQREMMQAVAFGGGNANPQMMMQAGMQIRHELDQGLAKILEPKQKERLDQIVLQAEGPLAVARPEIADKVGLNDEQQEYVQRIMMEMRRNLFMSVRQGAANGQFNPGQMKSLTAQLRAGAVQEVGKILDRKQKNTFNKMLGEPFDMKRLDSETASVDPNLDANAPAADPSKPAADTPQAKDASAADKEETTKESTPTPRKKGRTKSKTGSGANP